MSHGHEQESGRGGACAVCTEHWSSRNHHQEQATLSRRRPDILLPGTVATRSHPFGGAARGLCETPGLSLMRPSSPYQLASANCRRPFCLRRLGEIRCSCASSWPIATTPARSLHCEKGGDPTDEFIKRFDAHRPPVRKVSACSASAGKGLLHWAR